MKIRMVKPKHEPWQCLGPFAGWPAADELAKAVVSFDTTDPKAKATTKATKPERGKP
jgi:hypothetical protein